MTSVAPNTVQRVLRSPVVLTKKAKAAKARERAEKRLSLVEVTCRSAFRYLKGKCEKGKDCGFTHSKADPSKGDLEVQRRIAEKKAKESSGRDAAAGVVLGGDRLNVMLALVEESADAEIEEWIWGHRRSP